MRPDKVTTIYGPTGTGKSSLAATLARWAWDKYKKKTLVYLSDAGGTSDALIALAKLGIVYLWRTSNRVEIPETYSLASQGYWPIEWDPLTGDASPTVELAPPVLRTFRLLCPKGHVVCEADKDRLLVAKPCKECGNPTPISKITPGASIDCIGELNPFFKDVGGATYDSLSSMQDEVLRYEEAAGAGKSEGLVRSAVFIKSGEITYGSGTQAHYGFAQMRAFEWVKNSLQIPFLVAPPLFTAHDCLTKPGDERQKGESFYGPKLAGSARTGEITKYIGNLLGTSIEDGQWRLHLRTWYDQEGGKHYCKCRGYHDEDLDEIAPDGFLADERGKKFVKFNLGYLYEFLESIRVKEEKRVAEEIKDAPGLPSGKVPMPQRRVSAPPIRESPAQPKAPAPRPAGGGTLPRRPPLVRTAPPRRS